jgi:cytoskeletal protein CcmA (bactofilin family)
VATTLGKDTEFSGTLRFGDALKIEGKFEGDLASHGHLIIGGSGQVKAEVKVGALTVEGKLTGNITAENLVELRQSAEVFGDIRAAKIKIEEGVVFVGKAEIKSSSSKSQPLPDNLLKEGGSGPSASGGSPSSSGGGGGSSSSEKKQGEEKKGS